MSYELLTTQTEHDTACERLLTLAGRSIKVFDRKLSLFKLERPPAIEALSRILIASPGNTVQIAVQDAGTVQAHCPRLMRLLALHSLNLSLLQTAEHLDSCSDAFMIVDDRHCVVRFHRDQPRGKVIIDESELCAPYVQRFDAIWDEGGIPIGAKTLGL